MIQQLFSLVSTQMSWKLTFTQNLHIKFYSNFIHNCQNLETTYGISYNGYYPMIKCMSYEATEDMEESKTIFAKWKKAVWKWYILNESKYTSGNTWKRKNCSDNKKISSFQEPRKKVKKRKEIDKVEAICRAVKLKKKKKRLRAGGEGDDRRWDGWTASPPRWTWVWVDSGSWWWTGRPGVLRFMGLQRVGHDWVTELNWKLFSIIIVMADKAHHALVKTYRTVQQKEWNNVKYEL